MNLNSKDFWFNIFNCQLKWWHVVFVILIFFPKNEALSENISIDTSFKLKLGTGGAINTELIAPELFATNATGSDAMLNTFGFGYAIEISPKVDWFSVGIVNEFDWWNSEAIHNANIDRSFLMNLDLLFKFKHQLSEDLSLFLSLPIGFTLGSLDAGITSLTQNEISNQTGFNLDYSIEQGSGWNMSILGGLSYAASPDLRTFVEIGWTHWDVGYDSTISTTGGQTNFLIDQFALHMGLSFSFEINQTDETSSNDVTSDITPDTSSKHDPMSDAGDTKKSTPSQPESQKYLTIQASECNLRKMADRKSKSLEKLSRGEKCLLLKKEGNWYKVSCNNIEGYVNTVCLGE